MKEDLPKLNRHHARTLQEIFEHPFPRNIEWPDVVSLINHLGSVLERHDGKYEFQIGTVRAVFTKPHHKDVDAAGITELRQFLKEAGIAAESPVSPENVTVVLIDHHSARFFHYDGTHLQEREHMEPNERIPEADEFYERIAQRLKGDDSIVLIGDATGKSSAMTYLVDYLKAKHAEVAGRITAATPHDLSGITVADIEQIVRSLNS